MKSFAAWGLTILGIAVITTIAEMLLPKGKTRNVICSVSATVAVLVIITPLPDLFGNGFNFDLATGGAESAVDTSYLQYTDGIKSDILADGAVRYVRSNGHDENFSVSVTLDGWTVKSAVINFYNTGITAGCPHIHKSEIIKLVADYFGIGEEAVMSYG